MRKSCLAALLAWVMLFSLLTGCQAPASSQSAGAVSASQGDQSPSLPPQTEPDASVDGIDQPDASGQPAPAGSDLQSSASSQGEPEDNPGSSQDDPQDEPVDVPDASQEQPQENPDTSQAEPPDSPDASQAEPTDNPDTSQPPEPVTPSGGHTLHILMYHHVIDGDESKCNDWTTTTQKLREDLQWLKDHGYTSLLPSELASGAPLPEKAVLITFDDGYASNYHLAYPLLQEFQTKAVISVIVRRTVDGKPDFLTWDMCREMVDSGLVEIGSHTYDSHREDPRGIKRIRGESREEYEARIFPDIEESIRLIEENVGQPVRFFAYPHGQTESWADDFVREHFAVTVTTRHGAANTSNGFYDLPRYNINPEQPASKYLPD